MDGQRMANAYGSVRILLMISVILTISLIPLVILYSGRNLGTLFGSGGSPSNERSGIYYPTLSTLRGNSTIVVVVNVANQTAAYCDYPHPGCLARNFDFLINVVSYIKASGSGSFYVADSSFEWPVIAPGQEYVLFLTNNWSCAPSPPSPPCVLPPTPVASTYIIVAGAEGKFLVQNGLVYGYKSLYPRDYSWLPIDANGVPLDQFIQEVRS